MCVCIYYLRRESSTITPVGSGSSQCLQNIEIWSPPFFNFVLHLLTSQVPAHRSISGRAFKNTPSIPFISTQHHRSALAQVSCTLQVVSYARSSHANQQRSTSEEGTFPTAPRSGRSGDGPRAARAVGDGGGSPPQQPSEGEGHEREKSRHRRRSCCPMTPACRWGSGVGSTVAGRHRCLLAGCI